MKLYFVLMLTSALLIGCSSTTKRDELPNVDSSLSQTELFQRANETYHDAMGSLDGLKMSLAYCVESLKKNQYHAPSLVLLSRIYIGLGYISGNSYDEKAVLEAEKAARHALAIDPFEVAGHVQLASIFEQTKRFPPAVDEINKSWALVKKLNLTETDVRYEQLLKVEARLTRSQGKKNEFVQLVKKSTQNPKLSNVHRADMHNYLGNFYLDENKLDLAIEETTKATQTHPERAWWWGNLANIYHVKGDHEKAVFFYEKAISVRPYGMARTNLSNILFQLGIYYQAKQQLKELGEIKAKFKKVISYIEDTPESKAIWVNDLVNYHYLVDDHDSFIEITNEYLKLTQDPYPMAGIHMLRGESHTKRNTVPGHLKALAEAQIGYKVYTENKLQNKYVYRGLLKTLAMANHELGWQMSSIPYSEEAVKWLELMLQNFKDDKWAKDNLAVVRINIENFKKKRMPSSSKK